MTSQPECKISPDGSKEWYLNGERHRVDGPAVEYTDGIRFWYLDGHIHREDGPAIEHSDGSKAWCLNGKELNLEKAVKDIELQAKYPELIESMIIYLVHNS